MSPSAIPGGVVPPLCTPLNPDGSVDTASLVRLVEFQLAAGVDGLFVLGSTGEAAYLTDDDRRLVVRTVLEATAGRVPVLAGAIDTTTARVLTHARAFAAEGVSGIVVTAPFYARTHPREIERHFTLVAEGVPETALYAYDIPVAVGGVKLEAASVVRLAQRGVLAAVKDSSGNDGGFRRLLVARARAGLDDGRLRVFTGSELTVDAALAMGADGTVPGLGNVDPAGYVEIVRLCREGRWAEARAVQDRLVRLFDIVDVAPPDRMGGGSAALGAFKAALVWRGVIAHGRTGEPSIPLLDKEIAAIAARWSTRPAWVPRSPESRRTPGSWTASRWFGSRGAGTTTSDPRAFGARAYAVEEDW